MIAVLHAGWLAILSVASLAAAGWTGDWINRKIHGTNPPRGYKNKR